MQTFDMRALEFARSHLEDIKPIPPQKKKTYDVARIVQMREKGHMTFQEIADTLKGSKTHMYYLYTKAKKKKKQ